MGQGVYPGRGCTQGSSQIPGPGWTQHRVGYKHGPYLAKGPNSKVLSNSRVELDSQMGSMGTETTGSKWEWDQTPAKGYIPTD